MEHLISIFKSLIEPFVAFHNANYTNVVVHLAKLKRQPKELKIKQN